MSKTIEEILAPKPEARRCTYVHSIGDKAHARLRKPIAATITSSNNQ